MMNEKTMPAWVERMRAAGYIVDPATVDFLPDPMYVLPAPAGCVRRRSLGIRRIAVVRRSRRT
jgi:hypothetical protein